MNVNLLKFKKILNNLPECINRLNISTSNYLSKKSDKDDFITMVKSNKIQSSRNRLYVWGYAGTGALGEPQFIEPYAGRNKIFHQRKPWRLRWADRVDAAITNVACGNGFSLISTSTTKHLKGHHLFGTGMNTQSQIGSHKMKNGDAYEYLIEPVLIELPFQQNELKNLKILDISCGRVHSAVLTNLGIITFGNNYYGQCGRPIIDDEEYFGNQSVIQNISENLELETDDEVISIKCGQDHTCFLTKNGHVLTCGWSADGQLGQDIYTLNYKPTLINGDLKGTEVIKIATKGDFVIALSKEGEIFGWGNNEYKQLTMTGSNEPQIGVPKHLKLPDYIQKPIKKIAASGTHCLIIDANNKVWVWGFGLLGKGPKHEEISEPSQIPDTLFGRYTEIEHSLDRHPADVSCGLNSSAVTLDDGTLFVWGKNKYGNLGLGDEKDAYFPLRVNLPANVKKIECGPDQTMAICKTYL